MKRLLKITSILLIYSLMFLELTMCGSGQILKDRRAGVDESTLAPQVNVNISQFQVMFTTMHKTSMKTTNAGLGKQDKAVVSIEDNRMDVSSNDSDVSLKKIGNFLINRKGFAKKVLTSFIILSLGYFIDVYLENSVLSGAFSNATEIFTAIIFPIIVFLAISVLVGGIVEISGYMIYKWAHANFAKRFEKLRSILNIVIKRENAARKQFVAYVMISTNWVIDLKFTNFFLKPTIIGLCILSGNPLLYIVATVSPFVIGGLVRLIPTIIFRAVFPNTVKLTKAGLKALFIPWGPGNFAPILFLRGAHPEDLWTANEIRMLSKIIERSVIQYTGFSPSLKAEIENHAVKIAADIVRYQNCLTEYDCRRFKVRGLKEYSKEKLLRNIKRDSDGDKLPILFKIKKWILKQFDIIYPGHSGGTRPLLLFANSHEIAELRAYLRENNIDRTYLDNIFWFDLTGYMSFMPKNHPGSPQARNFIKRVFDLAKPDDIYDDFKVEGSNGNFHVRDLFIKRYFEDIKDGATIHILAPGGGGDVLGSILFIRTLKEVLFNQGKKNVLFKIFVPNIKYAVENPYSGPVPMEYLEGIEPIEIKGEKSTIFFNVKKGLKARIPIMDEKGQQVKVAGRPVFYNTFWSEGRIVEPLLEEGVELVLMDLSPKAKEIKRQYEKLVQLERESGKSIKEILIDMGGDCLIKVPAKINGDKDLEQDVASPVSDLTGIVIFDAPIVIKALGGDGEMGDAIPVYLKEYYEEGLIGGVFDDLNFLKHNPHILEDVDPYTKLINSEVSKNDIERLHQAVAENMTSWIEQFGAWNYEELLKKDDNLEEKSIRYEQRKEFLTRLSLTSLFIRNSRDIKEKVIQQEVLDLDLTWRQRSKLLKELDYITEDTFFITYRSQVKYISKSFMELLEKQQGSYEQLIELSQQNNIPLVVKLAALRAVFQVAIDTGNDNLLNDKQLKEKVGSILAEIINDKELDIFLINEVVKTIGMVGFSGSTDILMDLLENPKKYGKWNFYPSPFYSYARDRLKNVTERTLAVLIEKEMYEKGWERALELYNRVGSTHEAFTALKKKISEYRLKSITVAMPIDSRDDSGMNLQFSMLRLCEQAI